MVKADGCLGDGKVVGCGMDEEDEHKMARAKRE